MQPEPINVASVPPAEIPEAAVEPRPLIAQIDTKARMDMVMIGVQFFLEVVPDVSDLLSNIEVTHTLGPILDPTAYRDGMANLRWQTDILRGVQQLQRAIEPYREMLHVADVPDGT